MNYNQNPTDRLQVQSESVPEPMQTSGNMETRADLLARIDTCLLYRMTELADGPAYASDGYALTEGVPRRLRMY